MYFENMIVDRVYIEVGPIKNSERIFNPEMWKIRARFKTCASI